MNQLADSKHNYILRMTFVMAQNRKTGNCPGMAKQLLTGIQNNKTNKQDESQHLKEATIKSNWVHWIQIYFNFNCTLIPTTFWTIYRAFVAC